MTAVAPASVAAPAIRGLRGFDALAANACGDRDPEWLSRLRGEAAATFAARGLPSARNEEWRFTPLQTLAAADFVTPSSSPPISEADVSRWFISRDHPRLVLVDGRVVPELSSLDAISPDVTCVPLRRAVDAGDPRFVAMLREMASNEGSPFAALNTALLRDGVALHVPAGAVMYAPLEILHVVSGGATSSVIAPRTLVHLEAGATATIIETFVATPGAANYLSVPRAEIVIGAAARLEHLRIQREATTAWHIGQTAVRQATASTYRSVTVALGGRLSRHDLLARLEGTEVETLLYGLYLGQGDQLHDNHTAIHHEQPHCRSWEVYKGVLAGRSRAVFNGKVIVRPEAQQTDAKQTNRNLLLSDQAKVDTKPQLEIFADDVKCTHGATVGRLDEQQRYYLQTRGIGGRAAQALLIAAFVAEVLVEVREPATHAMLDGLVRDEMDAVLA